ncbi:MAG: serine hydrolase [Solobacterium sp.]|nr:serine hydrolase [Solobacterium sp.]
MTEEFRRISPEEAGVSSRAILDYIDALERADTEMHSIMIMRHDAIIAEGWWHPYAKMYRHALQSHSKTYTAAAVGIALQEGRLTLDERIADIFPEQLPENPSEYLLQMTIHDVLCMGTGMVDDTANTEHWIQDFLAHDIVYRPGTAFFYNNAGSTLLAAIVEKKTGMSLLDYLTPRLFDKIGIDAANVRCLPMADGTSLGAGGMFTTTEDNLRLMKLYKDGGVWNGERILPEDFVKRSTTKQNDNASEALHNPVASDNFVGYGYQIWMCRPEGVYRADGAFGQFTIVFPQEDMIISITETALGALNQQRTLDITWDFLKAFRKTEEDCEAYRSLQRKLASLSLPQPAVHPYSPLRDRINGRTIRIDSGFITPKKGFIGLPAGSGLSAVRFGFGVYGACMTCTEDGGEYTIPALMTGDRYISIQNEEKDAMQVLAADACFEGDNVLLVHLRWCEGCFEYTWRFTFEGDKVSIEELWTTAFPVPENGPVTGTLLS